MKSLQKFNGYESDNNKDNDQEASFRKGRRRTCVENRRA